MVRLSPGIEDVLLCTIHQTCMELQSDVCVFLSEKSNVCHAHTHTHTRSVNHYSATDSFLPINYWLCIALLEWKLFIIVVYIIAHKKYKKLWIAVLEWGSEDSLCTSKYYISTLFNYSMIMLFYITIVFCIYKSIGMLLIKTRVKKIAFVCFNDKSWVIFT